MYDQRDIYMNAPQEATATIRETLTNHAIKVEQVFLFGSRVRGTSTPNSDWDLYVLIDHELAFPDRHRLTTEIKRHLAQQKIPNDVILTIAS